MENDQSPIIAKWHQAEELEQVLLGRGNSGSEQGDDGFERECRSDLAVLCYCLDDLEPDIATKARQKYLDTRAAHQGVLRNQPQNGTI